MPGTCWLVRAGFSGRCAWALDDEALLLTPEGHPPEAYPVRELQGVGGDEYTVGLAVDGQTVALSRLGADGSTLRERLARLWLPARTQALRLAGSGDGAPFAGAVTAGGATFPFRALLFDDVLVFATPGRDVQPVFLALVADLAHDSPAYRVTTTGWDGTATVFSKLAGQTDAFAAALADRRAGLAAEAAAALASHLPALPLGGRATLGAAWPPGRMMELSELERVAPGFTRALASSWLAMLPRKVQGETLLAWATTGKVFLGYSRSAADQVPAQAPAEDAPEAPPASSDEAEGAEASGPGDPTAPLWLLAGRDDGWLLECLSLADHATYRFSAGEQVPGLVSQLLCAPQFSRTALYQPIEELVGDQAEFAPAARDLPFLGALRARFAGRMIHTSVAAWKRALDSPFPRA